MNTRTREYQELKGRLLKEKVVIEDDLKLHGVELEKWVEFSEKTFNFARYAHAWFMNGDLDTKRAIFACLSSDPTIKDRQLILNLQKPLQLIFEKRDLAEMELNRVGPLNTPVDTDVAGDSIQEFPLMSG